MAAIDLIKLTDTFNKFIDIYHLISTISRKIFKKIKKDFSLFRTTEILELKNLEVYSTGECTSPDRITNRFLELV